MAKRNAFLVGLFIITAYGVLISEATDSGFVVMLADVISGLSVIAIALLMFPIFKFEYPKASVGYLVLKLLEGGLMVLGGFLFLSASTESARDWIYDYIHLYAFIVGAFVFYYLLYKTKVVPRFLSVWGFVAITVLLIINLLNAAGVDSSTLEFLLVLIITNELVLALWLMVKGFSKIR